MLRKIRFNKYLWILFLCLSLSCVLTGVYYSMLTRYSLESIRNVRTIYAERTEYFVNFVFHKTDVLAAAVKLTNGDITESMFNQIAQIVYTRNAGIRGIQYMPRAVVTYSYPVEGNEAVIGKDFLAIPERLKDVRLAIDTKSIALSGPYHLIQGGLGLVARNPVFLKDEQGQDTFWGFSAIILDLPKAIESVGLGNLPASGYDFQLFCTNENNEHIVIAGNPDLDVSKSVLGTIQVPHHKWTIAIRELEPWMPAAKAGVVLFIGMLVSTIIWLLYSGKRRNEALTEAKERFFSDISHDMRTPLNAIIGFSELAQAPETTPAGKDVFLGKIRSSGQLLLDLINDTLTLSKIGSGKTLFNPAPVHVLSLIKSILEPVRHMALQKHVSLSLDTSGLNVSDVVGDRLSIQKIVLNILNNAVRFTPGGGQVRMTVAAEPCEGETTLTVTISDEGIGISPDFLPHIFDPFAQEHRKGYENTGTGLGLAIVKQLVDRMKGTITVHSTEGRGTTFTVSLPLRTHTPGEPADAGPPKPDLSQLGGKTVLLFEDNPVNREVALAILGPKGLVVDAAEDGQAGVERFAASAPGHYDAVLMDIRMPVMDGYEATARIRAMDRADAKSIPIIAMTADAFPEDIRNCLAAGMDGHLAKPIDPDRLCEVLAEKIQKRSDSGKSR